MLSKLWDKIKASKHQIFLAVCVGLIAFVSYNLGRIDALEKLPLKWTEKGIPQVDGGYDLEATIHKASGVKFEGSSTIQSKLDTRVVASKNSDKYHYTWCSGAKRISEANRVWFTSAQEAESKGYTLAGNCGQ